MNIQSITLTNFQKHSNLHLEFNEGVNIIYGSSDAGKSCIRRAVSFLFFGEPHSDAIRKIGTKQTSVKALLSSGWEVERIKSASINRVILRKDGVEKTFDAIGANIPEEVKAVLEVRDLEIDKETINLNIAKQLTLPFLYDKPATFRAKIFSMLTGNDLIDKVVQNFNKELLSISRDSKVETEFIEKNEPQLKDLEKTIVEKKNIYVNLSKKVNEIKDNYKKFNELQQISSRLTTIQEGVDNCKSELSKYSKYIDSNKLEDLRAKIKRVETLKTAHTSLRTNQIARNSVSGSLSEIRIPDVKIIEQSRVKIDRLRVLKDSFSLLKDSWQELEAKREELTNICQKESILTQKYRDLIKQAPICKECKQIIKPECIVREI